MSKTLRRRLGAIENQKARERTGVPMNDWSWSPEYDAQVRHRIESRMTFRERYPDADALAALADRIESGTATGDDYAAIAAVGDVPESIPLLARLEREI